MQFLRWVLEDARFVLMSLEAKFAYKLLFNRFQLSKLNGRINSQGEFFVIYTRRELSERLNIGEKRVSAAMNELREYQLIWERRCGRGYANQIYLASVEVSLQDAMQSAGGSMDPLPPEIETDETECLTKNEDAESVMEQSANKSVDEPVDKSKFAVDNKNGVEDVFSENEGKFPSEPQERPFFNRQNGSSRTINIEVQEPPICRLV